MTRRDIQDLEKRWIAGLEKSDINRMSGYSKEKKRAHTEYDPEGPKLIDGDFFGLDFPTPSPLDSAQIGRRDLARAKFRPLD